MNAVSDVNAVMVNAVVNDGVVELNDGDELNDGHEDGFRW
jgi:hypothetical protein